VPTAGNQATGFGPVIERLVGDVATHQAPELIAFETGQLVFQRDILGEMPGGLTAARAAERFRNHGIDATGTLDPNTRGLAGWDMCALPIDAKAFDHLGVAELREVLADTVPGRPVVMMGTGPLPATYATKTRAGRIGLLQILGFSDQPRGVKIRYKLASPSADRTAAPVVAPTVPPTDFDRVDGNPQILRLQLQQAEKVLALIQARYEVGTADDGTVRLAKTEVALLQAKLAGDRVQFARVNLAAAEDDLNGAVARLQAGLATTANRDAAQSGVEIARERLREAEARAAQDAPTAAPAGK
jgi:hypothetical protein